MLKQIQGAELKQVRIGQAVVSVCGPSDSPKFGMGCNNGVVVGLTENRWGVSLEILWDDGRKEGILTLRDPQNAKGIGVYAYPSLATAIS